MSALEPLTRDAVLRQQALLQAISVPAFIVDRRRILLYANPSFYRLTELRPSDIMQHKTLLGCVGQEIVAVSDRAIRNAMVVTEAEVAGETPAGRSLLVHLKAIPLTGPEGTPEAALLFMIDMSVERRLQSKYQKQLARERADRMAAEVLTQQLYTQVTDMERSSTLGALAGGVAHEINNPLQIIRGHAQLLEFGLRDLSPAPPDLDQFLQRLDMIQQSVARCQSVTQKLLVYLRTKKDLKLDPGDLAEVVRQAEQFFRFHPLSRNVELHLHAENGLRPVPMVRDLLIQLFVNLFLNACQAMEGNGRIHVRIAPAGGAVNITVADTGPGIRPEIRDHIFDPFVTTRASGGGTGLGLFLVHYIAVQQHGGTIGVDCPPSGGTAFTLTLPLEQKAEQVA